MLNNVDLPQPDGPITAMNSPGCTFERDVIDGGERSFGCVEALDDVVDDQNAVARRMRWPRSR